MRPSPGGRGRSSVAPIAWSTRTRWRSAHMPQKVGPNRRVGHLMSPAPVGHLKGWSQQESGASHESRARTIQRTPGAARGVGRLDSGRSDAVEICRLFNKPGAGCSYPACRYAHLCTRCHRPHPQFECGKPKMGRSRSPPPPRGDRKPRR